MKSILQVEDDPNDVFFLRRAMIKAGADTAIQVAADGREAIAYLQGAGKFADRVQYPFPSLVLMDLKLPYVMGLDVLKWIRKQPWTGLPVIMLTASAENADIAAAYRAGANAFLSKPSEARELDEMARIVRDFWLKLNVLPQGRVVESRLEEVLPA